MAGESGILSDVKTVPLQIERASGAALAYAIATTDTNDRDPLETIQHAYRDECYSAIGACQLRIGQLTIAHGEYSICAECEGCRNPSMPAKAVEQAEQYANFLADAMKPGLNEVSPLVSNPFLIPERPRGDINPEDEQQSEYDDIVIENLFLSVRVYNRLRLQGIKTIGDVLSKTQRELDAIPNFGKRSRDELNEKLLARGLYLREEEE